MKKKYIKKIKNLKLNGSLHLKILDISFAQKKNPYYRK